MVDDSNNQGIFTQKAAVHVPSERTEESMWAVLHLAELHVFGIWMHVQPVNVFI